MKQSSFPKYVDSVTSVSTLSKRLTDAHVLVCMTDQTIQLNDLIASANSRQTKLVSPIYSPENKVSPKPEITLVAGLFAGLFFGLLLMLGKRSYKAYKASNA
jgi:LPS O-antigen subunit length determinant protein (WzzB/FepE family)